MNTIRLRYIGESKTITITSDSGTIFVFNKNNSWTSEFDTVKDETLIAKLLNNKSFEKDTQREEEAKERIRKKQKQEEYDKNLISKTKRECEQKQEEHIANLQKEIMSLNKEINNLKTKKRNN